MITGWGYFSLSKSVAGIVYNNYTPKQIFNTGQQKFNVMHSYAVI